MKKKEIFQEYKEFYTIQARSKGKMPGFWYIHQLKVRDHYPGIPTDVAEVLSQLKEGEVQDIDQITEKDIIEIERQHTTVPRRKVNVRPNKGTVILCIDPNSDSDIVIEEGETDFKMRCLIMKSEKKADDKEEAEQADDEQSEQLTETITEPEMTLVSEQETEEKGVTISSTSTQDFDREKVEREFINLASHYKQIGECFVKLVEEVPHMKK